MGFKITKKQQRILDFIADYIDRNGVSPTYREIAAGLELKTASTVAEHIDNLVQIGVLRRSDDHGRVLEVVDMSYPETTTLFRTRISVASEEDKKVLLKAAEILGLEGVDVNE